MRNYVPAFIAIYYVFNNADKHLLKPTPFDPLFNDIDTLLVHQRIDFSSISKIINMDEKDIRKLNPSYLLNEVPYVWGQPMILVLPRDKAIEFLKAENQILATPKINNNLLPEHQPGMTTIQYTVQPGDFLHKIAMQYGCTIDDIIRWNKLASNNLNVGMRLVIWVKK